jgi:hypothetical protein
MAATTCTACGAAVDTLAVFPGGRCLTCWEGTPEGRYLPTADELTAVWGGTPLRVKGSR